jgi:SAM-dependent methyltransferase
MPEDATRRSFEALLDEAENRPLVGWDLDYDGRIGFSAPWDFAELADRRILSSLSLLDMGTGGGEWLSRRALTSRLTVATESWRPNVPVAQARLAPLGVCVVAVEPAPDNTGQHGAARLPKLPFADAAFDLVTNRHDSFVAAEVARVLAPDGLFLTQQVQSDFDLSLRRLLTLPARSAGSVWDLGEAVRQVRKSGLRVERSGRGQARTTFADVGALAWYLLKVPWVLPGVAPEDWRPRLRRLDSRRAICVEQPIFWLEARKATA